MSFDLHLSCNHFDAKRLKTAIFDSRRLETGIAKTLEIEGFMEPLVGFEPTTCSLRIGETET